MATEARRNGGRDIPLPSDDWKLKHKARPKPFGLRIYYQSSIFRRDCFYTRWYGTEKRREQGRAQALKSEWMRPTRFELMKRS